MPIVDDLLKLDAIRVEATSLLCLRKGDARFAGDFGSSSEVFP
eukprot:CAMPEP_0169416900 /NCGR_PEP_ID=MMETSP1017-20121227/63392_1 /TAXON_ID=342587 /ORGANISM="Karlodinium micrum, Strain CCMP2283" /LENGTH=42 /DNA_ID= /DNA_START= /DNA_END= /DNA_ORIENTATION=